ncbi:Uncharacterised protein [uncultured archaeon]|nr:Uncharacterised protein [uncultured archaeon]
MSALLLDGASSPLTLEIRYSSTPNPFSNRYRPTIAMIGLQPYPSVSLNRKASSMMAGMPKNSLA